MTSQLRIFKPTALVVIFILIELAAQGIFLTSHSYTVPLSSETVSVSQTTFGLGGAFSIVEQNGAKYVQVHWGALIFNMVLVYIVACFLAQALAGATHFRRPAAIYGSVALAMVGVAFLIAITISKSYWGYFLTRPVLFREIQDVSQVRAIVPIKIEPTEQGKLRFVVDNEISLSNSVHRADSDPYYCLSERILVELEKKKLLPSTLSAVLPELPNLYSMVEKSRMLAKPETGYDSVKELNGFVVDTLDQQGTRLMFLSLTGGHVSNDHYPSYELLFTGPKDGTQLSLKHTQRFFYDVAGIEGVEWPAFWMLLSIPSIVLGFVALSLGKFLSGLARKRWQKNPATITAAGF